MTKISTGKFKTQCLLILEKVQQRQQPIIITNKGIPIAKLVPADEPNQDVFGCMVGTAEITGDIEAPALAVQAWKSR